MNKKQHKIHCLKNQCRRLNNKLIKLKKISTRFSWYRLCIILFGLLLTFVIMWISEFSGWIIVIFTLIIFNILAYYHRKIESSIKRHIIWHEIKAKHIARAALNWDRLPLAFQPSALNDHPYEIDLNISGQYSLHRLLNISLSSEGSKLLYDWMLNIQLDKTIINNRQKIIKELIPLTGFRERLILNLKLFSDERLEGKKVLDWLKNINQSKSLKWLIPLLAVLSVINITLFILSQLHALSPYWTFTLLAYGILYFINKKNWISLLEEMMFVDDELKKSITIFKYLEKYDYKKYNNLKKLCNIFIDKNFSPSFQLRKLKFISIAVGLRSNPLLGLLLNVICPWDFLCAYYLNKCKFKLAEDFPKWLDVCYELEALISIANFAYLNPDYVFPEIDNNEKKDNVLFYTENLGHPLIPENQKVNNDFSMKKLGEIMLITGSNMSGKSTFLRTVGINLCLAYIGAPVNASILKTSLFRIFTSININDSLNQGISQFYAEVKRLKQILTMLNDSTYDLPLFYFVDEIYKGTNNRERLIGSRSFIKTLIGSQAFGLISTHDLELTKLADSIPNFKNYHFKEEIENGKMVFDYKIHHGPCPTTNALKIMEMEGLPVDYGAI